MSIRKILYPLDFSGTATSNRIEGELRTIGTDRYRAFTLNFAPFYTSNLTIKERGKTKLLVRGTDYECLYFYPELTKLAAGKEICGVVVITNSNIGVNLEIGYNTVGGHYAHSAEVIQMAIQALELDNRNVYWQNIIDTPELFQPTPHNHDLGDIYGMEFMIDTLVAIREAIMIGDNTVHQQIYDRIDSIVTSLTQLLDSHRTNYTNPHKTTAHQVNAYTMEEIDTLAAGIMQDLADLEPRFQSIATAFTQVQQQYTSVTSAIGTLSTRVGTVENEQSKFYTLLGTINQTLTAHQTALDNLNSEVTRLNNVDNSLQTQINGLKTRVTNTEDKNTAQDGRLDTLESVAGMLATRVGNLETGYVSWTAVSDTDYVYSALISKIPYVGSNGNMEIGSEITFHHPSAPDPAASLSINPASATAGQSTIYNSGYFNCQDIWIRSDLRDKSEVTRLAPDAANVVLRELTSGIRYKLHAETAFTAGLAAQEVLEVFPEAVGVCLNDQDEERLVLRNSAIIGLLVSGYNFNADKIDELLQRLAAVEAKLV